MHNRNSTQEDGDPKSNEPDSNDRVSACPDCGHAGSLRPHNGDGTHARNPDAYRRTDYTCRRCGSYVNETDVVTRPPEGPSHQSCAAGSILLRKDITTWEEAREASQQGGDA